MSAFLPSVRQLQYLLALHEHGHFGRAATACFVTQSTLSSGIGDLERLLDVTLVERTKRFVRFTSVGENMVERARLVVRGVEDLAETAQAEGAPLSSDLRLAVIPTIAPFVLPRLLPQLRRDWPVARPFIREASSRSALDALHRGAIDCVLLALPFDCGEVDVAAITTEPLLLGLTESDARRLPDPIATVDIDVDRLLLLEDGNCLKDHALAACERPDMRSDALMLGTSLHTLVQMIDHGFGLTLLPKMAVDAGILEGTRVVARPLASDRAMRRIALVWRKGSARTRDYQLLAETIIAAIR
ncbi:MAG: LysR family transcriptional regulator [Sphingomonadaceae bacterium]|nr:LysR family transcriptional regulator [Sphingomonadaceae bacterium]